MLGQKEELIPVEIYVKDDKIAAIGQDLQGTAEDATVIDAKGGLVTPGLIDVHVHLREPGFTYKETIETGTQAAASRRLHYCLRDAKPESSSGYGR